MKRIISLSAFLLLAFSVMGQTNLGDFEKTFPDSLVYYFPSFAPGRVIFRNGEISSGILNIATIDQTLRFIDESGKELSLDNNNEVDRVSIGGKLLFRVGGEYAEMDTVVDDVILCRIKKLEFKKDSKKSAYGMHSETTNISSVSNFRDDLGSDYSLSTAADHRLSITPVLMKSGKRYTLSQKAFEKLFPNKREIIRNYLESTKVDFMTYEDVAGLMNALK